MAQTRECDYCGADIEPGTGTMFVHTNGTTVHFCSSKCEKNADLGREARDLAWTDAGRGTGGEDTEEASAETTGTEDAAEDGDETDEALEDVDEDGDSEDEADAESAEEEDDAESAEEDDGEDDAEPEEVEQ